MENNPIKAEIIENNLDEFFSQEFQESFKHVEPIVKAQEKFIAEDKIPDKEIGKKVSKTRLEIDIALASLAKATSVKLLKLEKFLSKIEDILYDEKNLEKMKKSELISLYMQTRVMKTDTLKQLQEIRKNVDFEILEAHIASLHIQKETQEITSLDEIIEKVINDENFLEQAIELQKEEFEDILKEENDDED